MQFNSSYMYTQKNLKILMMSRKSNTTCSIETLKMISDISAEKWIQERVTEESQQRVTSTCCTAGKYSLTNPTNSSSKYKKHFALFSVCLSYLMMSADMEHHHWPAGDTGKGQADVPLVRERKWRSREREMKSSLEKDNLHFLNISVFLFFIWRINQVLSGKWG